MKAKKLHGILLECSFPQKDSDRVIYGHLDTKSMIHELQHLQEIAETSLEGFKVMVTHRKESHVQGFDSLKTIQEELLSMNDLGIHFLFPSQGDRFTF